MRETHSRAMDFPEAYHSTVFLLEDRPFIFPPSFAIITAWNPMDRQRPDTDNVLEDEALRRTLELKMIPYFRATGCSPDLTHREPGWAATMAKSEAIDLGRRFGQRGIWWIEGDDLILVSCTDGQEKRIDTFSLRLK
jgi:hypothetical protein